MISHDMTGFFKYLICGAMNYESRNGLTLLDEVSEGQDREIEWPRGALVSTKWRTSCRLSKIYGSYNALHLVNGVIKREF